MLQQFLSQADSERASATLRKLARHDLSKLALTGGLAIEIHCLHHGRRPSPRPLNDIDFICDSFDCIPASLANDFVFQHVHPFDPPAKTLVQMIDPATAIRVDIFRAYGSTMHRTIPLDLPSGPVRLVSLEDLIARTTRLTMDLREGVAVPSKHAKDLLRLVALIDDDRVEEAWRDHRKPQHPLTFLESRKLLQHLIPAHPERLLNPKHQSVAETSCSRCASTAAFRVANPQSILNVLRQSSACRRPNDLHHIRWSEHLNS